MKTSASQGPIQEALPNLEVAPAPRASETPTPEGPPLGDLAEKQQVSIEDIQAVNDLLADVAKL